MSKELRGGDYVKINSLNREGIILEVLKDGMVRVTLGNLPITVSIDDITHLEKPQKKSSPINKVKTDFAKSSETEELDLHARNSEEAIRQVEEKINRALMHGMHRLKIVHGIGTGKIKEVLYEYLNRSHYVQRFHLDDFNPGVTWVYL